MDKTAQGAIDFAMEETKTNQPLDHDGKKPPQVSLIRFCAFLKKVLHFLTSRCIFIVDTI